MGRLYCGEIALHHCEQFTTLEGILGGGWELEGMRKLCLVTCQIQKAFLAFWSSFIFFLLPHLTKGKLSLGIPVEDQLVLEIPVLRLDIALCL
jgi:hypothetical protein